jgi:hypothetical protein
MPRHVVLRRAMHAHSPHRFSPRFRVLPSLSIYDKKDRTSKLFLIYESPKH